MIKYKRHLYHNVAWATAHFLEGQLVESLTGRSDPRAFRDSLEINWEAHEERALMNLMDAKSAVEREGLLGVRVAKLKPVPCCKDAPHRGPCGYLGSCGFGED